MKCETDPSIEHNKFQKRRNLLFWISHLLQLQLQLLDRKAKVLKTPAGGVEDAQLPNNQKEKQPSVSLTFDYYCCSLDIATCHPYNSRWKRVGVRVVLEFGIRSSIEEDQQQHRVECKTRSFSPCPSPDLPQTCKDLLICLCGFQIRTGRRILLCWFYQF